MDLMNYTTNLVLPSHLVRVTGSTRIKSVLLQTWRGRYWALLHHRTGDVVGSMYLSPDGKLDVSHSGNYTHTTSAKGND